MTLNMENFTNYWGKFSNQITLFNQKPMKKVLERNIFFKEFIKPKNEPKRIFSEQEIQKIQKISKSLEENYLQ